MPMRWDVLLFAFSMCGLLVPSSSGQDVEQEDTSPYSDAILINESDWIQPGVPFTVGLQLTMDPGWHSYWENPGDSGEPTDIAWDLPDGYATGPIQWTYPERIDAPPLRTYGYSDEVLLLTEITPPSSLQPGTSVDIKGTAYWLICEEICLPAEETIALTLPVKSEPPAASIHASTFAEARLQHPVPLEDWTIEASSYAGSYVLQVTPPDGAIQNAEGAYFYSADMETVEHAAPQPITREGASFLIALQQSEYASRTADRLRGTLVAPEGVYWDASQSVRAISVDVPVVDAIAIDRPASSESATSLLVLLLLACAGGLLLNLMPCVFPILSIKMLGFAGQRDQSRTATTRHGLTFALGVLVSFWILAGLLLALRAAGSQIGWGFQLQSPLFVAIMALLFFAIGLNLMGVFEVGSGMMRWSNKAADAAGKGHVQRAFFDGVLATLVATPCTAPFMGAALGAAIVLPVFQALLIFTALGIGMALPYVVLSMSPALLRRLPRPGPWMETLKHVLAFPMLATTVWLVWVFGKQTGIDGVALLLVGILLLSLALWITGRWPAAQLSSRILATTRSTALIIALLALTAVYTGASYQPDTGNISTEAEVWKPFSIAAVDQLRDEGQPVFIDFTAAWCLTCQVNKRTTLNTDAIQGAFRQKGVTLFQADWTNQDAEITRALENYGRNGVPLYVLYTGTSQEPMLLPEILTEAILLDALSTLPDHQLASK